MGSRTVFTVLEETAARRGDEGALHQPDPGSKTRKYRAWSWNEYRDTAAEIAVGLSSLGLRKGDVVGLASETRAEFYLADMGIMASGCVAAALYTSYTPAELIGTLRACGAKVVLVEDSRLLHRLSEAGGSALPVRWILMTGRADGIMTMEELRRAGRASMAADPDIWPRIRSSVEPEDHAILYLTSGATGEPKMALVTHRAIVANLDIGAKVLDIEPGDRALAFLPSAHITQRLVLELLPVRCAVPVWFAESLMKLHQDLKTVRPTFFVGPPRLWERVYTTVCTEIRKRSPLTRKVFHAALGLGLEAARLRREGKPLPAWMRSSLKLADKAVFSKLRERFGGAMRVAASGSAPLGEELAKFYMAIGFPLYEGYGLTEGGVVALNPLDRPKPGSIGRAFPGVEVRLASDGELLIRSETLFSGYLNDPHATAQVLRDGWLSTGDLARIDEDGYLFITGRKKDVVVTSSGRKVFPSLVENLFKLEPVVSHVFLVGDRLPYIAALVTVNAAVAETLKGMEKYAGRPFAEIVQAPPVVREVRAAVARVNRKLAAFEQIRKFRILPREFTVEEGELTATLKVRRGRVMENFEREIAELYAGKDEVH